MTKRILIIDDEPSVRDAFELALTGTGYRVECAVDGVAGVEAASRFCPDLVFLDLKMPGIDGVETLRRLAHQHQPLPPVYFVTAFAREFVELLQRARTEKLAFQLATKPLTVEQIRQIALVAIGAPE